MFCRPDGDLHWSEPDALAFARSLVADLRTSYARYPGNAGITELVTELLGLSGQFAGLWAEHEVRAKVRVVKRTTHPLAGPLEFECQVLHVPGADQRLIVYCAAPGSATQLAFRQLAGVPAVRGYG
jgi:hypothetical protein